MNYDDILVDHTVSIRTNGGMTIEGELQNNEHSKSVLKIKRQGENSVYYVRVEFVEWVKDLGSINTVDVE